MNANSKIYILRLCVEYIKSKYDRGIKIHVSSRERDSIPTDVRTDDHTLNDGHFQIECQRGCFELSLNDGDDTFIGKLIEVEKAEQDIPADNALLAKYSHEDKE